MRKCLAEFFGTFCLVFAGTGAIVVNDTSGGTVTHIGIALTFGLVVLALIYALGDLSGCHLNPAVTVGFYASRRIDLRGTAAYLLSQSAGAISASAALLLMFPDHPTLGATNPSGNAGQSWAMEFFLTLFLMVVILCVSSGSRATGMFAGIAIGSVIALEALFAGPVSGASMNPARSLGPALVTGRFAMLWIYLTAPVVGALAAVAICRVLHGPGHVASRRIGTARELRKRLFPNWFPSDFFPRNPACRRLR